MLSIERKREWDERGLFVLRGFAPLEACRAIHQTREKFGHHNPSHDFMKVERRRAAGD
ncbi:MAG: hypothetical protein WCA22_03850 [Candidatus Binatus sp.]